MGIKCFGDVLAAGFLAPSGSLHYPSVRAAGAMLLIVGAMRTGVAVMVRELPRTRKLS
jgi:hypothetical protein